MINRLARSMARLVLAVLEFSMVTAAILLATFVTCGFIEARYVGALPAPTDDVLTELPGDSLTLAEPPTLPAPRLAALREPTVAVGHLLGRIEAPSVRLVARVLEGTDSRTLFRGAGHIESTPFPGQSGNAGIAGHRDTVFRPLREINVGDPITVTTASRVLEYKVAKTWVVNPEDVHVLQPTANPALTLVTCYPFSFVGPAPQRFVVRADLISATDRRSTELVPFYPERSP